MSDVPRSDPTDLRRTRVPEPLSLASVPNPQEAKTGRARRAASTALATAGNTASRSARFPASESSSPGASAASARREAASDASTVTFVSTSATYSARPACTDSVAARSSAAENGGALEAAWHARRSASAARDAAAAAGVARLAAAASASLAGSRAAAMAARPLARMVETGSWPRRSACGGGDARFPDRYASSKAARAASKRPDATAAALVSARRIAATQAPRVTDGEFERDAHKTPSNASERICVASPVSSPVRRSLKEATQPETLLASPPRIHAHSSTARGDAFARITAAATRTASRVTFATSRDCKACCFVTSRPHANSTNVQPSTAGTEPLSALPAKPSTARAKKTSGPTTAATSLNPSARSSLRAAHELWSSSASTSSSLTKARSVSPSFAALAPSFGNQRGAAAAAAAATRRAHATSSSAGGPTRPPHALWDSNAAAISVHGCSAAAGDAPGASPAMASHSASRQKHRTSASAPASGGGFEPSAAARRSSLLSDRFFAFLSFENSLCGTYARPAAASGPVPNASAGACSGRAAGGRAARHATLARTSAARARRSRTPSDALSGPPNAALALSAPSFSASARLRAPPRCTAPDSAAVASVTAASTTRWCGSSAASSKTLKTSTARSRAALGHAPGSMFSSKLAHAAAARSAAARAWWSVSARGGPFDDSNAFVASASSAGNASAVAAPRSPSTVAALLRGWMESSFDAASSGSTSRTETTHASPAATSKRSPTASRTTAPGNRGSTAEETSGCRAANARASRGAREVGDDASPPSARPNRARRSATTLPASHASILHASAEMASETWVKTARGGASTCPPAVPTKTFTEKLHASASSASRMATQSFSPSTACDCCVRVAFTTLLRSSTCSALAQNRASRLVRSVASRRSSMERGHAWSERRKCCNHSSAARRSTGSWLVYSAATARPRDARSGGGGAGAIPAPGEDAIAPIRERTKCRATSRFAQSWRAAAVAPVRARKWRKARNRTSRVFL